MQRRPVQHFLLFVFYCACGLWNAGSLRAQYASDTAKWSLQVNLEHQDRTYIYTGGQLGILASPGIRPQISVEAQRYLNQVPRQNKAFVLGQLGVFRDFYESRWLNIRVGLGWEFRFVDRFYATFHLAMGFAFVKPSDTRYVYSGGQWVVTPNRDPVQTDLTLTPGMDLGCRILKGSHPIDVFVTGSLTEKLGVISKIQLYYAAGFGARMGF